MGGGVWQDKDWRVTVPPRKKKMKKSTPARTSLGETLVAEPGLLLPLCGMILLCVHEVIRVITSTINLPRRFIKAWRGDNMITDSVNLNDWHKDELADWDRNFLHNTGRSVEKILNPPPRKPSDYHVLVACTCPDCTGVKKPKTKLGGKR